jgi:hypothetical protein
MKKLLLSTAALGIGYALFLLLGHNVSIKAPEQTIKQEQKGNLDLFSMLKKVKKEAKLPRRMDDVTVWTDIHYAEHINSIIYVYKVDLNSTDVSIADMQDVMIPLKEMNIQRINAGDAPQMKFLLSEGYTIVNEYYGTDNAILGKWHINPSDINN